MMYKVITRYHLRSIPRDGRICFDATPFQAPKAFSKSVRTIRYRTSRLSCTRVTASEQLSAEIGMGIAHVLTFFSTTSFNMAIASALEPMCDPEIEHMFPAMCKTDDQPYKVIYNEALDTFCFTQVVNNEESES